MIPFALFHGDLNIRIQDKTIEIQSNPTNGDLYFQRGKLFFQHEEYEKSIRDFQFSRKLNTDQEQIFYYLSRSFFAQEELDSAGYFVEQHFKKIEPVQNPKAVQLYGQILLGKGNYCEAALKFDQLLSLLKKTIPKHYLDAANAHEKCASEHSIESAIVCMNQGISTLGPLYVFRKRLVKLYINAGDFNSAINEQTIIVDSSKRKENALAERARIRLSSNEPLKALKDLDQALVAIAELPAHTGNNKATQKLKSEILDLKK